MNRKLSTTYQLEKKGYTIKATLYSNGKFRIERNDEEVGFNFTNSKPETLEAIGRLFIEASKLQL